MGRQIRHLALVLMASGALLANLPAFALARSSGVPSRQQAGPAFVFPSDGTVLPYNSTLTFQVQPVSGAVGYLWSFVQNGGIAWQNLDSGGSLSSNTYTMKPGSRAHNSVRPGPLQVRVRAQLGGNHWTAASAITVRLQGKGMLPVNPQPTPKPGPPAPGTVLYFADTSGGLDRWTGSSDWKHLNGMLINDGSDPNYPDGHSNMRVPYYPGRINNYVVEAQVQVINHSGCDNEFGIRTRVSEHANYNTFVKWNGSSCSSVARIWGPTGELGNQSFDPGNDFHTYRIEVRDNTIKLEIDGATLVDTVDNRDLGGGGLDMYCHGVQLNVRSFKVIAL